ncbi:MAG: competence/damage-inducible protein A [Rhodocyclaceae bacterium]|nr:MAG: competence/damage-inducible protein A [Rhodocyclaceae bacterium]
MEGWGALIIGDEIMRGSRPDKHFTRVVEILSARGLHLKWAMYIGDDRKRLTETLRRTMASGDGLFSFGGIGVTPDDHTRQAAAEAACSSLALHPDAETAIRARFAEIGAEITPQRLQLGEFPVGSRIIPNPFNRIPGFSLDDHHFFPGFPQMAWPMLEWVLDTYYSQQFHATAEAQAAIIVWEGMEGTLLELMRRIDSNFAQASLFSLPSFGTEAMGRHIELGMRGDPSQVNAAMAEIKLEVTRLGYAWEEKR